MTIIFDPLGSVNEEDFSQEENLDDLDEQIQSSGEISEIDNEKKSVNAEENITLDTLYSATFDMQATIATILDIDEQIKHAIDEMGKKSISPTMGDTEAFETVCMDIIERIVRYNKDWTRKDAIQEAAKELVAVRKASQSLIAETVHMRVLREFQIATNKEYLFLRQQIWGE